MLKFIPPLSLTLFKAIAQSCCFDSRSMNPRFSHYPYDDLSLNIEPGCYTLKLLGMIIHTLKILIDDEIEALFMPLIPSPHA